MMEVCRLEVLLEYMVKKFGQYHMSASVLRLRNIDVFRARLPFLGPFCSLVVCRSEHTCGSRPRSQYAKRNSSQQPGMLDGWHSNQQGHVPIPNLQAK